MNTVCIKRNDFMLRSHLSGKIQKVIEFCVWEPERGLTHGIFCSVDFPSVEAAEAAAGACLAKFEKDGWASPFVLHRRLVLSDHGGAMVIARLVASLYNGCRFPWDASSISMLDQEYLNVALQLMTSYHRHGESDPDFMSIGNELAKRY